MWLNLYKLRLKVNLQLLTMIYIDEYRYKHGSKSNNDSKYNKKFINATLQVSKNMLLHL